MAFTRHGHYIPGTDDTDPPETRARCGGPGICADCSTDAGVFVAPTNVPVQGPMNRSITPEEIEDRFGYHAGTGITMPMHRETRRRFKEIATYLDAALPNGRAKSIAFTELESAAMWANKAIAEIAPVVDE